ncbi:hypothetical protein DQ04_03641090 [Trypanosoma grayi]|uniref:hypothetical protein n=1 Tax=Trypanosoma grayi TaxID=71804 RepID=UPI0004F4BE0F|nr:hypothetical protein DQ04_03641090 [Trypanosoma grayi]KEG10502.1 hypothetical protein DQ04_03641090 [Trypanosoma grayi]
MRQERQGPARSGRGPRSKFVMVCFSQIVVSSTLLVLFVGHLTAANTLLQLSSHVFRFSCITAGALAAQLVVSVAAVVSVWVCFPKLLLTATLSITLLLVAISFAITWVVELRHGAWNAFFASAYDTNGDDACPGIAGGDCCGWDYCPYPMCPFAHRSCDGVVAKWAHTFFMRAAPMLSLALALGVGQTVLGLHLVQQSWWWRRRWRSASAAAPAHLASRM